MRDITLETRALYLLAKAQMLLATELRRYRIVGTVNL
jgi:hypothetical protein